MNQTAASYGAIKKDITKNPSFFITFILTLSLTIGALICALTLAYHIVVAPLSYPEQDSLYVIEHIAKDADDNEKARAFTYQGLELLYRQQSTFSSTAMIAYDQSFAESFKGQPLINVGFVTPEYFQMLGAETSSGQLFNEEHAVNTFRNVAVISYQAWQQYFELRHDVLGKPIQINGASYTVMGVLQQNFQEPELSGLGRRTDVFLPWDFNTTPDLQKNSWGRIWRSLYMLGKAPAGMKVVEAQQNLSQRINAKWQSEVAGIPVFGGWHIEIEATHLKEYLVKGSRQATFLFVAAMFGLVLITAFNISNLVISRTAERFGSYATKVALGAKRKNIAKDLFTETASLLFVSAVIGLAVAGGGLQGIRLYLSDFLPRMGEVALGGISFVSAIVLVFVLSVIFTAVRLMLIDFNQIINQLRSSGKGTTKQVSKRVRNGLITSQVVVAFVIVMISLNITLNAVSIITSDKGYELNNIYSVTLYDASIEENNLSTIEKLKEILASKPEVAQVSASASPLLPFGIVSITDQESGEQFTPEMSSVDYDYFGMIKQSLISGRVFTQNEVLNENRVVIVNESFARLHGGNEAVLGKFFDFGGGDNFQVIGVVRDLNLGTVSSTQPRIYTTTSAFNLSFLLQVKPSSSLSRDELATYLSEKNPMLKVFEFNSLQAQETSMLFSFYLSLGATLVLILLVVFLTAAGIYGIINYNVIMRRTEIATRLSIGARSKDIHTLFFKENFTLLAFGVAGAGIILFLINTFIYPITSAGAEENILVIVFSLAILASIQLSATLIPVRRVINKPLAGTLR